MKYICSLFLSLSILVCNIGIANDHINTKLFIINRTELGGIILLTASIDFKSKAIILDFNPAGDNNVTSIKIGRLVNNDIKILASDELKCLSFSNPKQSYQTKTIKIPEIKHGDFIVIWVDKIISKDLKITTPLGRVFILNTINILKMEQTRLAEISAIKGQKAVVNEVGRNYEE